MRRILCLLLALTLLSSLMLTAYATQEETDQPAAVSEATEPEDAEQRMSEAGIDMIKKFEGFSKYPYWDVSQWTVGYGTSCPSDKREEYKANGITEAEAESLLRSRLKSYEKAVRYFSEQHNRPLEQHEFDALVSFTYNLGSGWVYKNSNFRRVMADKNSTDAEIIFWFGAYSSASGSVLSGLVRRRMAEANLFVNGQYGTSRPSNYCYVKLDANGGSLDSRVNAYDINTSERVNMVPTRDGYTFLGWYTEESGGTKVTVLDKSISGDTIYARWSGESWDESAADPDAGKLEESVDVTVTSNDVNLRKGAGTNYTRLGSADRGDKLTITHVLQNGSLLWGKSAEGWIALRYTNYEDVLNGKAEEPGETEPEKPELPIPGVVKVNSYLIIRTGPSTGYAEVGRLYNGDKVEILAQKVIGALTWGQIDKGWICLTHVVLGEAEPPAEEEQPTEPPVEETPTEPPVAEEKPTETGVKGTVKVSSSLLIRTGPGIDYDTNGSLRNGVSVTITKQEKNGSVTWGYMGEGWISMNFVVLEGQEPEKEPGQEPEQPSETAVTGTVKVNPSLTIRKGPDTTYGSNGSLKNGDRVTITKQEVRGTVTWGYMGKGWISMRYVVLDSQSSETPDEPAQTPSQPENTDGNWGTVTASDGLSIRQGPATTYAVKGYYSKDDRVEILDTQKVGSVDWGKTNKGWICLQFVKLDNAQPAKDIRTVTASCLTVRTSAGVGYKAVDYLYKGTQVEILETRDVDGNQWGRIASGWICLDYTK